MNRLERLRSEEGVQQEALLKTRKQEYEALKREVRRQLMPDRSKVPVAFRSPPLTYTIHHITRNRSSRPASSTTSARGTSEAA